MDESTTWSDRFVLTPVDQAVVYEKVLVPGVFNRCAGVLLDALPPGKVRSVVDVGTGTGAVAKRVAQLWPDLSAVAAVDVSAAMLEVAHARSTAVGSVPIHYVQAPAESLPFGNSQFDLATCQHVLQFVADPGRALREMARIVRPGGWILVAVWDELARNPIEHLMSEAGLVEVKCSAAPVMFGLPKGTDDLLWLLLFSAAGPEIRALAPAPRARFEAQLYSLASPWMHGGLLEAPASMVVIRGYRG
ncbi:class I SAM-dependent methyltransferase [Streptomyces sp. NRRL B-1347]|uniref:class I SAM-dependent methyltransferase n=1 Tax=Streptomyces sp. NRRL B-1347 TaxID=1476877 RepID=UPI0006914DA9|nr:methyltransferase domain-containing protein [Streptomyces sp. NRRL B-1347]